jgi:hypothetical protein
MPIVQYKNSTVPGRSPSSLAQGEIAINLADNKMWVGQASGTPLLISQGSLASQSSSNVAITGGTVSGTTSVSSSSSVFSSLQVAGGQSVTNINTSVTAGNSTDLHTQAAAKAYVDSYRGTCVNMYTFTGNGTYTKSSNAIQAIRVIVIGGGGGGRGHHESGGGGGYAEGVFAASGITSVTVTVGGGSGGGGYFGFSGQGATTSFGGYISASGGHGANANRTHAGGHGGYGFGGSIQMYGGGGLGHAPGYNNFGAGNSGEGGGTFMGGSAPAWHSSQNHNTVGARGTGGVGSCPNSSGGDGVTGICIVYEYK